MPEVDLLEAASRIRAAPSLLQLSIFSQNCDLPRNFLSDGAPLLSEAILDSCGLACDSPLLHSLTSLELLGGVDRSVMEARLPDALRNMPLLETLAVDQVYCDAPAEPIVVPLPKLRRLQLQATHPLAITIFDYITFPASTFVMIEIYGQSFPADTPFEDFGTFWRGIARILSPEFHSDSQRIVKTLAVDGDNGYRGLSFTLRAWHDNLPFDSILDQSPLSSPDLTINVGWSNHHRTPDNFGDPEFFEMVFLAAFGALHLPALETLHLGAFPKSIGIEIQVILMPHLWTCPLRTLILHVERCALYLPELLVLQQDNSSLSVPSLETLVFTHCNWDHELARELLSSLRARAMRGSKLQKIVMRACTNNVEVDLRSFQDVAKEVDWDSANTESIRYARH
ncbi:hypothetical protein VNI00_004595 [Paramarasmius palmivorus]|uniref:Uncharacterized protein n=1 Tax=Paramarasmius palmivorus TaxID=297713 RepID=A0AAW0DFG2_9AGAR